MVPISWLIVTPSLDEVLVHLALDVPDDEAGFFRGAMIVAGRKQVWFNRVPRESLTLARMLQHANSDEHLVNLRR